MINVVLSPTASPRPDVPGALPLARRRTRVAIVGAGYVSNTHLEILAGMPEVEVVAVCDADPVRAETAARRWGIPHTARTVEELAGVGIDAAHVLVPPDLHVPVTRALLELGIGVLVEKPLAPDAAGARELEQLARDRGLPLGVNHNQLHHPAFTRLLEHIRAGRIGRVEHVQLCWSVPLAQLGTGDFSHWMFRSPRNIIFEQAPHPFSQVHALIGRVVSASTTLLGTRELHPGQIFHDRWLVAARGERGTAEIYLAFGQSFPRWTLQVIGSDGSAEADCGHNLFSFEAKSPWLDFWNTFLAGVRRSRTLARDAALGVARYCRYTLGLGRRQDPYYVGMQGSIQAFYTALRSGEAPPVDGGQAAAVLDWCEAVAAAAAPAPEPPPLPEPGPPRPGEVAVLGGTGFIGRRVVARLVERGLPVTAVVRRTHGMPAELVEPALAGTLRLARGRLEDGVALAASLQGARTVIHLATGGGVTWEEVERAMVRGSVAAAEAALAQGVERFVYVSSVAALYAGPDCGAAVLEDSLEVDPRAAVRDVYSRGKAAAEEALLRLHRERGLPLVIVRPGVVLGPGTPLQHPGFGLWVRDNHCVGWGRGDTPLPVVDVDDVADALVRVVTFEGHGLDGRALNLCARTPLTAREIVEEMARVTGRDLRFHPRPLWWSQVLEIGKWIVKRVGGRSVPFPAYRDLKSRALAPQFSCRTAREVLGWQPVEDREELLEKVVRIHAPSR